MRARADIAIFGEIRNILIDHRVMAGVYQSDILPGDEELTVGLLVEDKKVNGKHLKDRARIVAGGHRQNKSEYADLSTQTVNTESVFILLAVAAFEKRSIMVIDVRGAYLNAKMRSPGGRNTFVVIDGELAKMFVSVDPELAKFVDRNGKLTVNG